MTLTTSVRINWPVSALTLLDVATRAAGGEPEAVEREEAHPSPIWKMSWVGNRPDQGLNALLWVRWREHPDTGDDEGPKPPALVVLAVDTPHVYRDRQVTGWELQAEVILPAVRDWLDHQQVPRDQWWWEDEAKGTFHPGTVDVATLADRTSPRDTWSPPPGIH